MLCKLMDSSLSLVEKLELKIERQSRLSDMIDEIKISSPLRRTAVRIDQSALGELFVIFDSLSDSLSDAYS